MKAQALILAMLASSCNKSVPEAKAETVETIKMAPVKVEPVIKVEPAPEPEVAPAPAPKPEPKPKPKPKMTEDGCRKLLYQFDQCGWRCIHHSGNPGYCVNACRHFLDAKKMKCLRMWGPGFG